MTANPDILPDDAHNAILIENVHPSNWVNPEPAGRYNLVVIGAGPIGCELAQSFARFGSWVTPFVKRLLSGWLKWQRG